MRTKWGTAEVLAEFAKLPLPQRMRVSEEVIGQVLDRYDASLDDEPRPSEYLARSGHFLKFQAAQWEAEDAKAAHYKRIVEEFGRVLASEVGTWPDDEWDLGTQPNYYTDKAEYLLAKFPHIAEGWPSDE